MRRRVETVVASVNCILRLEKEVLVIIAQKES